MALVHMLPEWAQKWAKEIQFWEIEGKLDYSKFAEGALTRALHDWAKDKAELSRLQGIAPAARKLLDENDKYFARAGNDVPEELAIAADELRDALEGGTDA